MSSTDPADRADRCFVIDGVSVPFEPGQTLMEAAQQAGHVIPHLCWHPSLGHSGACRLCTVQVDGRPVAACTTRAGAGQVVENRSPAQDERRRVLLQMLFVEGNHYCPGCEKSGHCRLQAAAADMGMSGLGFDEFAPSRAVDASHPTLWLDTNRCILCKLCVRASHEVDGKTVFAIGGHGIGSRLLVNSPSGRLGDSALADTDLAAHVCPVGALLPKRQGFAVPIGQRPFDRPPAAEGPDPACASAPAAASTLAATVASASAEARAPAPDDPAAAAAAVDTASCPPRKLRVATVSLAGCFGCHMSLLDIDERLFTLAAHIELDRSPLTDLEQLGPCDIGLVEGGLCNAENVHVLREFRARCRVLVAVGACAVNGGLPAQRNAQDIGTLLQAVYGERDGLAPGSRVPDDPELPLPLAHVHPLHEVVHVDHFLPGCPPGADTLWAFLEAVVDGRPPALPPGLIRYD